MPPLGKPGDTLHIGDMTKTPEKPSTAAPADVAKPTPDTATPAPDTNDTKAGDTGADDTGAKTAPREIGGRGGPDPTRYGDWEKAGRCVDF